MHQTIRPVLAIGLVLVLGIAVTSFLIHRIQTTTNIIDNIASVVSPTDTTRGFGAYRNHTLKFGFAYPLSKFDIQKTEGDITDNGMITVFPKDENASGLTSRDIFQVYVVKNHVGASYGDSLEGYFKTRSKNKDISQSYKVTTKQNITWYCLAGPDFFDKNAKSISCLSENPNHGDLIYRADASFLGDKDYFTETEFKQVIDSFIFL